MTDDDVRAMLARRAEDVHVSPDAWDAIAARIAEGERTPARRFATVAGGAVAAAALVGAVLVAQNGTETNVATPDTSIAGPPTTAIVPAAADPIEAARSWLQELVPAANLAGGQLQSNDDGNAVVLFRNETVDTEVHLRQLSGRPGWVVVSAASDLIPIFDASFVDGDFSAEATAEAAGKVHVFYRGISTSREEADEPIDAEFRQSVPLRRSYPGESGVMAWIVLEPAGGGPIAVSAVSAYADAAKPAGSYVAVFPAVDSAGLADLQAQADAGDRADLLDPRAVAGAFLAERLPRNDTPSSYTVGEFQRGDSTSGEVPYTLSDGGASGTILLRSVGEPGSIWYVTGALSDDLEINATRREETHLIADVRSKRAGTLTWNGATPIEVRDNQIVSIGRPNTPIGNYPVVVQLRDGERTLAVVAQLG